MHLKTEDRSNISFCAHCALYLAESFRDEIDAIRCIAMRLAVWTCSTTGQSNVNPARQRV